MVQLTESTRPFSSSVKQSMLATSVSRMQSRPSSLTVSVRRLHDINLNGAWLIPFAGLTVLGSALSVMGAMAALLVLFLVPDVVRQGFDFILLGSVITVVAGIAYAVCMAWPSNPAGARFDKSR